MCSFSQRSLRLASAHTLGRQARSELHAKRREEKELRSVEKEHVQQISVLEGEVANLNKSLERSRESYESMKRSYTATCEEADRLRTLVADLRRVSVFRILQASSHELTELISTGAPQRRGSDSRAFAPSAAFRARSRTPAASGREARGRTSRGATSTRRARRPKAGECTCLFLHVTYQALTISSPV